MDAKEYLEQARHLDMRIHAKLKLKEEFKGSPGAGEKLAELEAEIDQEIDELAELKLKITQMIRRVSKPEYRTVLELRYLSLWTWEKIAMNMNYSENYIYELHRAALKAFEAVAASSFHI